MKKSLLVFLALLLLLLPVFLSGQEMDTVVLLDTSESMFPYFQNTIDYLVGDILKNQLKEGDTFHLITFDSEPHFEISRKLRNEKDIQDILSRVLLLQPLGRYTDLIAALVYVNAYTNDLSSASKKRIIILTDGIHDPPPGSIYKKMSVSVREKIKSITENMRRKGWDVSLVRFPRSEQGKISGKTASSGNQTQGAATGIDLFPELSRELNTKIISPGSDRDMLSHKVTGDPLIIFPGDLGKIKRDFYIPFKVKNYTDDPVQIKLTGIRWKDNNLLKKEISVKISPHSTTLLKAPVLLPSSLAEKTYTMPLILTFANDMRPYPRKGTITFTLAGKAQRSFLQALPFKIFLLVLLILFVFFILLLIIKKSAEMSLARGQQNRHPQEIYGRTERGKRTEAENEENYFQRKRPVPAEKNSALAAKSMQNTKKIRSGNAERNKTKKKESGSPYELIIDNQNRRIGLRNVQWFTEGSVFTVGGSRSDDFLVFIYPVEAHIAEITMEKGKLFLKIINKNFFPDVTGSRIQLDSRRVVQAVSTDNRTFTLRMEKWISPLERINRILHLIDTPGSPDFTY